MFEKGDLLRGEAGSLLSLTGTLANAGDPFGDFLVSYASVGVPALLAAGSGGLVLRYRYRRRAEMRITASDKSMANLERMRVPRGRKASQVHPGMPAVTLRRMGAKKTLARIKSAKGVWHYAGEDLDEPHVVILGRSGVGKNETLFDPAVLNAIFHRPDAVVINDVKGAVFRKFHRRVPHPQYVFTFDGRHRSSAAINLIETPEMARRTAAALYPTAGEKVKIYNRLARALFLVLAEHLSYGRSGIEEVYRLASDRRALERLAEEDVRVAGIVGGQNKTLAGDIVSSLTAPLEPLRNESVARAFRSCPDQADLSAKVVVWIIIPEGMEEELGPLAAAIMRNLYERAKASPRPVRFFVDEAASCLAFDDLAQYVAVGRGAGVYFTLVLQDISRLSAKIGRENALSVLGSAGVHYWGPTNDPETARYVSELSGTTEVARAVFEHYGFGRKWRQIWSDKGAPYEWRYFERAVLPAEHVTGCPKGWWYRYAGDPHRIELVIPTPMYEWPKDFLPKKVRPRYRGFPKRVPQASTPQPLPSSNEASEEIVGDEVTTRRHAERSRCDSCGREADKSWSWCPNCSARL